MATASSALEGTLDGERGRVGTSCRMLPANAAERPTRPGVPSVDDHRDRDAGPLDPAGGHPRVRDRVPRFHHRQRRAATIALDLPATRPGHARGPGVRHSAAISRCSRRPHPRRAPSPTATAAGGSSSSGSSRSGSTSALCGLAPTMEWLVVFRLLQGAAGALLVPGPLSLITANFEGGPRPRHSGCGRPRPPR